MADLEIIGPAITGNWSFRQGTIKVAEPTLETHAATRLYVDANSAQGFWEINLDDDLQMKTARDLQMQNKQIINLADPTLAQDAATKEYVDTNIGGAVDSVFGRTGAIVAVTNDYTWAQINKATSDIADLTTKSHTSLTSIGVNSHAQIDTHIAATNPHTNSTNKTGDTFTGSMTFDDGVGASPRATFINGSDHEGYIELQTTSGDLILDTDTGNIELNAAGDIDAKINQIKNVVDPTTNQDAATKKYVDDNAGASPLTTKGDIFTYSTVDARLPVGTNTFVLSADSSEATGLKWVAAGGGATTINVHSSAYSAEDSGTTWSQTHQRLQNDDGVQQSFYANLDLPDGGEIDSVIVHGNSSGDSWQIFKVNSSGTATSIATDSVNTAVTSIGETIDNTTYSYVCIVNLANGTQLRSCELGIL